MSKPKVEMCETYMGNNTGGVCGIPATIDASYDGGDWMPYCSGHFLVELQQSKHDGPGNWEVRSL